MGGELDVGVESELDGFSRVLPLPYRVALIIVMGMYPRPIYEYSQSF
jgi:hypothetical protein